MYQSNSGVVEYYEKGLIDYQLMYFRKRNYSMNYGFWDEKVKNRNDSLYRLYEIINEKLKLNSKSLLLDVGCGLGEASCWFAKVVGCFVNAITIIPSHVKKARKIAQERGLSHKIRFQEMDYTKTKFSTDSFDAVIAIETISHLDDKTNFYKEVFRILAPGGKLSVAEFTLSRKPMSNQESDELNLFLGGWKLPNIWSVKQHTDTMKKIGFRNIVYKDYSDKTIKTAHFLYKYSFTGIPVYWFLNKLGLINNIRLNNAISCKYQWITKQKGIWGHTLFTATK